MRERQRPPLPTRPSVRPRGQIQALSLDLSTARVVDVTHTFDPATNYWPTSPATFEFKVLSKGETAGGFRYDANTFCTSEHGGTHVDAPVHFAEGAQSNDQVPIQRLMVPALVFDVRDCAGPNPDHPLPLADVKRWEPRHGQIPKSPSPCSA